MAKSILVYVVLGAYENGGFKATYTSSLIEGATYKVQRTGNTITYLVNDVVFHTSATTSSVPLYMDTAFFVVVAGITVVSITPSGLSSKSI
jgi:hypothetical protein